MYEGTIDFFFLIFYLLISDWTLAQNKEESLKIVGRNYIRALDNNDPSIFKPYLLTLEAIENITNSQSEKEELENLIAQKIRKEREEINHILMDLEEAYDADFEYITEDFDEYPPEERGNIWEDISFQTEFESGNTETFQPMELARLVIQTELIEICFLALYLNQNKGWVFFGFDCY